jgi:hypothetical protein
MTGYHDSAGGSIARLRGNFLLEILSLRAGLCHAGEVGKALDLKRHAST